MIQAKRVVGSTMVVDDSTFLEVLDDKKSGLIVTAKRGFFSVKYQYQISYQEFTFLLETCQPIVIPEGFTVVLAEKIHNPALVIS
ncbi:MAG: hypothetical protein ACJATV_001532 [Granulosicoccus sp.]